MKSLHNRRTLLLGATGASFCLTAGISATQATAFSPSLMNSDMSETLPTAPSPKKIPHAIEQLGVTRVDDYHWMKDDNWQAVLRDPSLIKADVKEALLAENAYSKAVLASTENLQTEMFNEMKGRIKEDDVSVPMADGAWEYYTRFEVGAQHPIHARRPRTKGDFGTPLPSFDETKAVEQILLDEEARSKGHDYYETSGTDVSKDHSIMVWGEDTQGSEYYTLYVKNIASGELIGQPIESTYGAFVLSPDNQYLFWVWRDENSRPAKIYRRKIGDDKDTLIYEEKDEGFFIGIGLLSSEDYISISVGNHETNETWLIPASNPTADPKVVSARETGLRYDLDHWEDRFIVLTNADNSIDFKIMESAAKWPVRSSWKDMVAHQAGRYITGVALFKRHMVRTERENANTRIVITDKKTLKDQVISVNEDAYNLGFIGAGEYDTDVVRYSYTSPTTPTQTYDYHMGTQAKVLRKTQIIPSGHNPADYVTKRLYAKAADGVEVPITVLMKAGTKLDGSAPLLLYGYGSYGISMDPNFSIRSLTLVNRGFIYAIAHIRGGTEKGYNWFLTGRKFQKKNTFTDFIACAEHLVANGYGRKGRIVAYGGSAGGMLMGAIANMRPDLWAGVIGAVPFVDVLNTMSDTSLPLTPPEWPEWGNPLEDKAAYDYIVSYSPYDNITAQAYPSVLATGGLSDPRVTYWEPMKWIAKLREKSTSGQPMLLKINMEAGHGGASGRFDFLKEIAFDYAFAIWAIGRVTS